jgi:hypothetical protein
MNDREQRINALEQKITAVIDANSNDATVIIETLCKVLGISIGLCPDRETREQLLEVAPTLLKRWAAEATQ